MEDAPPHPVVCPGVPGGHGVVVGLRHQGEVATAPVSGKSLRHCKKKSEDQLYISLTSVTVS